MIIVAVGKTKKGEELAWEHLAMDKIATLASTQALFGGDQTFVLEGALYGERAEEFMRSLEIFSESPHTFVFVEEKLLKHESDALKKAGATLEIEKHPLSTKRGFDSFGVAQALGTRDRKRLWLGLMQSFKAGERAEAVAGLLCWKARQMKSVQLSRDLVRLYHDSHRGAGDLELLLERFALTL